MPISVSCTCGKDLSVKDSLAGKNIRCPECQGIVTVPGKLPNPIHTAEDPVQSVLEKYSTPAPVSHLDSNPPLESASSTSPKEYLKTCPVCGGSNIKKVDAAAGFQAQYYKNRVCKDCNSSWNPGCPKLGGIIFVAAGLLLVIGGVAWLYFVWLAATGRGGPFRGGGSLIITGLPFIVGFAPLSYGIGVLTGRLGQLEIFTDGRMDDITGG